MNKFFLSLKGAGMGIAEVIPGVSGGTIAFITGIYERLLEAIKAFDLSLISLLVKGRFREVWKHIDGNFLLFLIAGMACGVVIGVFGISYLMENYPEVLYAFFFGLILASAWYIGKQVKSWGAATVIALIMGVAIAFVITKISPAEGSVTPVYIIVSGFLAISALMLPGISGSFILLLLGMYTVVIGTLKNVLSGSGFDQIWILLCFIVGMVTGLVIFSRVLTWMFQHYHQVTLALLTGFMIGSLAKIWPWRMPVRWVTDDGVVSSSGMPGEHDRVLSEKMVLPGDYTFGDPYVVACVLAALGGILVIFLASIMEDRLKTSVTSQRS